MPTEIKQNCIGADPGWFRLSDLADQNSPFCGNKAFKKNIICVRHKLRVHANERYFSTIVQGCKFNRFNEKD